MRTALQMLLTQHPHRHTTLNGNLISYPAYSSMKSKKIPPFIDKTAAMPFKICLKVEYFKKYTEYGQLHGKFWK